MFGIKFSSHFCFFWFSVSAKLSIVKVNMSWRWLSIGLENYEKKYYLWNVIEKVINQDYWRLNSISYLLLVTKRIETKTKKYGNFARSTWNVGFFLPVRSFWMNQQKCIQITIKQPTTLTDEWEEKKLDTNSWLFPFSM